MWRFPDTPLYSCPDGIIYSEKSPGVIDGVIEVKCPSKYEFATPSDVNLIEHIKDGEEFQHSKYYFQVQGHLAATNAPWCDFITWSKNFLHVERIRPDPDWMVNKLPLIKWAVLSILLPRSYEIDFWKHVKNSLPNPTSII